MFERVQAGGQTETRAVNLTSENAVSRGAVQGGVG